jgi:hypothetical protein
MTAGAAQMAKPRTLPLRLAAWCSGPAAIAAAHFLMLELHPTVRMWVFVGLLFFWMKTVVLIERRRAGKPWPPGFIAWLLLWPGMRPVARAASPRLAVALQGLTCIVAGVACMFAARWVWAETGNVWTTAPLIMVGFSLILHYGLFALVIAGWRATGCNARPLFRNPFASRSLNDFWTRRWNLAYVEMCQETLLRAARGRRTDRIVGPTLTSLGVFLFSGLLHEVAISLPVNAGYGLPMLYFALNGGAMLIGRKFTEGGILARAWAAFWVIAPLPLLFHPWFIDGVLLPMVGINT